MADEYQPLSEKELKFGYWFVTNKFLLRNILIVFLFATNFLVWGYILYSLVFAFGIEYQSDQLLRRDIAYNRYVDQEGLLDFTSPRSLQIVSTTTYPSADNRIDAVATLRNPNLNWGAEFSYQFVTSDGAKDMRSGFVLPSQSKFIMDLDVTGLEVTDVRISDVRWIRENNVSELVQEREQFEISNVEFIPQSQAELPVSRATFTVLNNSNYNYFEPTFQVFLRRGGQTVAVNEVTIDRLRSRQSRDIDVRWVENIPAVANVQIVPNINYMSSDAYLDF